MSFVINSMKKAALANLSALKKSNEMEVKVKPTRLQLESVLLVDKMPIPHSATLLRAMDVEYRVAWLLMCGDLRLALSAEPYGSALPSNVYDIPAFLDDNLSVDRARVYKACVAIFERLAGKKDTRITAATKEVKDWANSFTTTGETESIPGSGHEKEEELRETSSTIPPPTGSSDEDDEDDKGGEAGGRSQVVTGRRFKEGDLELMSVDQLIDMLAEGLKYDGFDPVGLRNNWLGKAGAPSFKEVVAVCTAYVFVGNNPSNLNSKVVDQGIGKDVLSMVNKFGVVAKKTTGTSLTLARVAIAFSPVVYFIRLKLHGANKLPSSGVITTTAPVLQDVCLSGVRNSLPAGSSIEDFLIKFNRVLTKAREKASKNKTSEEDMDATAKKFSDLSIVGATKDIAVSTFDYARVDENSVRIFFEDAVKAARAANKVEF